MSVLMLIPAVFLVSSTASGVTISPKLDWTEEFECSETGFQIKWIKGNSEWITMEMQGPTTGWIAIGFSPNGGMEGADIIMGWVDDNGQPHLKDLHGVNNSAPLEDAVYNYELLGFYGNGSVTGIRFRRKWNTCDDSEDYKITQDTLKLIWAFGDTDPAVTNFKPSYHGKSRWVKNAYLKAEATRIAFPDTPGGSPWSWDIMMAETTVPAVPAIYLCTMAKYPELKGKHHIIGWRPLIDKKNSQRVHHILLYECNVPPGSSSAAIFEQHLNKPPVACYTENMPPEWSNYCWTVPIAWTLGQEGEMLPDNVGLPMGEVHGGANYFMLEYHYENRPDVVEFSDNSGIRVYYTDRVREFDMETIWIGNKFSGFHFIPPKSPGFYTIGGCSPECTTKAIPPQGITATHVILHAHEAGTEFELKHIRDGKELRPLGSDKHYDNDYQQARILNPPVKIMPGDTLLSYCKYDTMKEEKPLYGGITTKGSEMCLAFLFYYPKIALSSCQYQTEFHTFLNSIGVNRVEGKENSLDLLQLPYKPKRNQKFDLPDEIIILVNNSLSTNPFDLMIVKDKNQNQGKTVSQVIDNIDWKRGNGKMSRDLKVKLENGRNYAFCTGMGRARIPLRKYITTVPKFIPYREPRELSCLA